MCPGNRGGSCGRRSGSVAFRSWTGGYASIRLGRSHLSGMEGLAAERSVTAGRLVIHSREATPVLRTGEVRINMGRGWTLPRNDRLMAAAIRQGRPIRDAHVDRLGQLREAREGSVLARERDQLRRARWEYDDTTQEWKATAVCTGTRFRTTGPCP